MPTIWYEGRISRIEDMAPQVRRFFIELPDHARLDFHFKAGQFITMDLPLGDKRLQRWRSYSIASAPSDGPTLELCIVRSENGLGTRYLFEQIKPGDTLRFKGPEGHFTLPEQLDDKDVVMVCTGTGIAPFRSMLRECFASGKSFRNLHLIFGSRFETDILYRDEMTQYARQYPGFRYDIALSRQADWSGYRGYVHPIYSQIYAEKRSDILFMLCGWTPMIDEAVAQLVGQLGYAPQQVRYELYG